jgi:hypothetical protein
MNRRRLLVAGVILTGMAWASFSGMDAVPDYSPMQDALQIAGYMLCALALAAFYTGFTRAD